MKKLFLYLVIALSVWSSLAALTLAQTTYNEEAIDKKTNELFNPGKINVDSEDTRVHDNLNYVDNLPNKDEKAVISNAVQDILFIGGSLAIIAIIVAAIFYITAMGNDDAMNKAKNIILYTIIGLVIISIAYGIVIGVSKLRFFE